MNTNSVQFFKNISEIKQNPGSSIILAAWQLSNPENIGKIIRLAHNIAAEKVVFIKSEENHREAKIKKTAGFSYAQMNWEFVTKEEFIENYLSEYPLTVLETCDGAENIFTAKLPAKTILLAGSESKGIPEEIIKKGVCKVFIPMPGGCKSMNISNALSVAAFEWFRQQCF